MKNLSIMKNFWKYAALLMTAATAGGGNADILPG